MYLIIRSLAYGGMWVINRPVYPQDGVDKNPLQIGPQGVYCI